MKGATVLLICSLLISLAQATEVSMVQNIHWLGHDTFRIDGKKIVFTDPFQIKKSGAADIIMITHGHYDHCSPEDIGKLQKKGTVIVATPDCASKLGGDVRIVRPGDTLSVEGVQIEVVPAYNTNKKFHTKDQGWVGYVVTIDNTRIYLAGDTDYIPEMKTLRDIDIALLPVSGTYVMTADEAVKAALDIRPKIAIPMHYGAIVGDATDAKRFASALKGKVEVRILEKE